MTHNQLVIGNAMLKYFASKGGQANTDSWDNSEELKSFEYIERGNVRTILEQRGYLEALDPNRYWDMLTEKGWEASQSSIEEETRLRKEKEEKKHLNIIASQVSMVDNKGDNNFIQTHVANLTEAKKEGLLKKIWSKIIVTAVAGLFGALIHMYFKN